MNISGASLAAGTCVYADQDLPKKEMRQARGRVDRDKPLAPMTSEFWSSSRSGAGALGSLEERFGIILVLQ
jgi:hypothetical protein